MAGITTGVTGGRWRASISPFGALVPFDDDEPRLDWHIAADDRWHSPESESTVRQRRVDGVAVVETRVRIPEGDAVQRVYSVADHGGLTVIEIENDSPLPIAVAFTHGNLLSRRPPTAPIAGISLPPESVAFPIGHRATLVVAVPHKVDVVSELPTTLPTASAVARGWLTEVARAGRMVTPDAELNEHIVAVRCELALCGAPAPQDDALGFILVTDQLVRMGGAADAFVPQVAGALEAVVKSRRSQMSANADDWLVAAALSAADRVLAAAGESRARGDLNALVQRIALTSELPNVAPPDAVRWLTWVERSMVAQRGDEAQLLPAGLPPRWEGNNFEVFELPTRGVGTLSYAVRWHGDRPAILWEQAPPTEGPVTLTCPILAPEWRTAEVTGEALWPRWVSGITGDN